jgi:hypothetical protein
MRGAPPPQRVPRGRGKLQADESECVMRLTGRDLDSLRDERRSAVTNVMHPRRRTPESHGVHQETRNCWSGNMMVKRLQLTHVIRSHKHSVRTIIETCNSRRFVRCYASAHGQSISADHMNRVTTADIATLPALVRSLGASTT